MRNGFAKTIFVALLLVTSLTQGPVTVAQQGRGLGRQTRDLNNELLGTFARLRNLPPGNTPAAIRSQAESIIGQRAAVLEALIEEDPGEALSLAFSPDLLGNLAVAFPNSSNDLETAGEWEGPLEVIVEDSS